MKNTDRQWLTIIQGDLYLALHVRAALATSLVAKAASRGDTATSHGEAATSLVAGAASRGDGATRLVAKAASHVARAASRGEAATSHGDGATRLVARTAQSENAGFPCNRKKTLNDLTTAASKVLSDTLSLICFLRFSQHRAFGANQAVRSKAGFVAQWQPTKKGGDSPC